MKKWIILAVALVAVISVLVVFAVIPESREPAASKGAEPAASEPANKTQDGASSGEGNEEPDVDEPKNSGITKGMRYAIFEGEVTITGYTNSLPYDVTIPDTIEGLPVTSIGKGAFRDCEVIVTVNMPTVTSIGDNAFSDCEVLTTVNMPAVVSIGNMALFDCNRLETVDIPACTIFIGANPFADCDSLATINVAQDSASYVSEGGILYNKDKTVLICCLIAATDVAIPATVKDIAPSAFYACKMIETINIPDVVNIGDAAFKYCEGLITVNLPAAVNIGDGAFRSCFGLITVNAPAAVNIGNYAFEACEWITTIDLPVAASIGDFAFCACAELTTVNIPAAVNVGDNAFDECIGLTTIDLPATENIGAKAFNICEGLKAVNMPAAVTIGDYAFRGCALTTVTIPASVASIGAGPFALCESLTKISVAANNRRYILDGAVLYNIDKTELVCYPLASGSIAVADTVTSIGSGAFAYCTQLTVVSMPHVTNVGDDAFFACENLESVNMPAATAIGESSFCDCALTTVNMPAAVSIGEEAFRFCTELATVTIGGNVERVGKNAFGDTAFLSDSADRENGALYLSYVLLSVELKKDVSEYVVKEGIKTIGDCAFEDCDKLTKVTIPACTAFIGANPFVGCKKLATIDVAEGNMNYTSDGGILYNKDKTLLISYPTAAGEVVIDSTVTSIGAYALQSCPQLKTVRIHAAVSIGTSAFASSSALTAAYFYSDAPESFGSNVFDYCDDSFTVYFPVGAEGWTTPQWNTYFAQEFTP